MHGSPHGGASENRPPPRPSEGARRAQSTPGMDLPRTDALGASSLRSQTLGRAQGIATITMLDGSEMSSPFIACTMYM